ncbi:MAG: acetyl-CoA carboxylase biotin carboxyl carrier protein [Deferrisomatales bacterium]
MPDTVHTVTAPLMGIFYRAAAPGQPPLAEVGQQVAEGDVVCVLESMKIFTELRAGRAGTVTAILVENEDPVMKNQPLIEIASTG